MAKHARATRAREQAESHTIHVAASDTTCCFDTRPCPVASGGRHYDSDWAAGDEACHHLPLLPSALQAEQEKEMARRRAAAAEQERLAADRVNLHIKAGKQAHAQQTKDEAALQKVWRR